MAADDVLGDAKKLKQQAQEELARIRAAQANHSPAAAPAPNTSEASRPEDTKPGIDAELLDLVEDIQLGGPEAAAAALAKMEERIARKMGNVPELVTATIRDNEIQRRVADEAEGAVVDFFKTNPDFEQPLIQSTLMSATQRKMERILLDQGLDPRVITGIMVKEGLDRGDAAAFAYRGARTMGLDVPGYKTLMDTAASEIRDQFGLKRAEKPAPARDPGPQTAMPVPPSFAASRQQRRETLSTQPKRSNMSPGAEGAAELSQEDKYRKAVQQSRMYRKGR
jgi:hypothetical protein